MTTVGQLAAGLLRQKRDQEVPMFIEVGGVVKPLHGVRFDYGEDGVPYRAVLLSENPLEGGLHALGRSAPTDPHPDPGPLT